MKLTPQLLAVCSEFADHLHDEWSMTKVSAILTRRSPSSTRHLLSDRGWMEARTSLRRRDQGTSQLGRFQSVGVAGACVRCLRMMTSLVHLCVVVRRLDSDCCCRSRRCWSRCWRGVGSSMSIQLEANLNSNAESPKLHWWVKIPEKSNTCIPYYLFIADLHIKFYDIYDAFFIPA